MSWISGGVPTAPDYGWGGATATATLTGDDRRIAGRVALPRALLAVARDLREGRLLGDGPAHPDRLHRRRGAPDGLRPRLPDVAQVHGDLGALVARHARRDRVRQ